MMAEGLMGVSPGYDAAFQGNLRGEHYAWQEFPPSGLSQIEELWWRSRKLPSVTVAAGLISTLSAPLTRARAVACGEETPSGPLRP